MMSNLTLDLILFAKRRLDDAGLVNKPYRFLFLGYTDIHATDKFYKIHYGDNALEGLVQRPNVEKLKKIHGVGSNVTYIPTLSSLLTVMFGEEVIHEVFDFQHYEGSEHLINLNDPVPEEFIGRYDFIIDAGTTEHVFDYAQALRNCASMLSKNGIIYHGVPMNWPNHGFYNISPTLYHDFYEDNGFETILFKGFTHANIDGKKTLAEVNGMHPTDRFSLSALGGIEVDLRYMAQKKKNVEKYVNPIQRKYRDTTHWT